MLNFSQPAVVVAQELLGKIICRKHDDGTIIRLRITETEAYAADCPFVYQEPPFYTVVEWLVREQQLMVTCFCSVNPDNVVIMKTENCESQEAVVTALNFTSDDIWLEDGGETPEILARERSFLPDNELVNFRIKEK